MQSRWAAGLAAAALIAIATPAYAPAALGTPVGAFVPFSEGGMLGLIAIVIVGGAYILRRKR